MLYPNGPQLVDRFLESLSSYQEFEVVSKANPLKITFNGKTYVIYFKCVSYAGNPYPKNTTRAQLPKREEFNSILDTDIFFFFGYDVENDLYVCWDPIKTRSRLNQKSYVSFFSRQSLQDSVKPGEVKVGKLTNGDVYVLFKREDVCSFFEMYELHFSIRKDPTTSMSLVNSAQSENLAFLDDIGTDDSVKLFVDELLSTCKHSKLEIVSACMNNFGAFYKDMRFIDWANLVSAYMRENA